MKRMEGGGGRRWTGSTNCVPSGAPQLAAGLFALGIFRFVGGAHETGRDKGCGWSGQVVMLQRSRPCGGKSSKLWKLFGRDDELALLAAALHVSATSRKRAAGIEAAIGA